MRKPTCICETKGADQLCSNCTADQYLCFRYTGSTIPLLLKSEISGFYFASVTVLAGLCQAWSEPQIVGFLMQSLISKIFYDKINIIGFVFRDDMGSEARKPLFGSSDQV